MKRIAVLAVVAILLPIAFTVNGGDCGALCDGDYESCQEFNSPAQIDWSLPVYRATVVHAPTVYNVKVNLYDQYGVFISGSVYECESKCALSLNIPSSARRLTVFGGGSGGTVCEVELDDSQSMVPVGSSITWPGVLARVRELMTVDLVGGALASIVALYTGYRAIRFVVGLVGAFVPRSDDFDEDERHPAGGKGAFGGLSSRRSRSSGSHKVNRILDIEWERDD